MSELSGVPIPADVADAFEKVADNPDDVRKLGIDIATDLSQALLDAGAPGIHFFTMNTSTSTREIFERIKASR